MEINLIISTIARKRTFSSAVLERKLVKEKKETRYYKEFNSLFIKVIYRDMQSGITANTGIYMQE